ncbi:bifunctional isocitrate dehydrogenase kinase/phosphatase [Pseudoalteromonas tunicata]|jgi:isocitrate dehydrogenase kinase/phosphatase|uniref:Isocitrate dehydrogenase kinase/phosphatase n=1 Tax=Pseudoalteromonas tunicata D2 TaxID=87626 RepID=A4CAQ2_9GAMM|nr:bifunctional isocitrate dehydrogenase kinase/phosphatase [Pseudoalteromonas tunicata]ATC95005.1 isocitrate dehydrogenase kinase/phosphatase [Pseudoalteromonas tunicata]AXT30661.1 bifunctional isocitrate dehydrogenase kinase/phosphatase [Pseudoalteromonas tunicata]EAR28460.1 bifunctional isocitrate dehydrogenase kinase/phosphatase protein [Pseudoalteromonas tunicata D2]
MAQLDIQSVEQLIATKVARSILASFEAMFAEFLNITLGAQSRFEQAKWLAVQDAMRARLKVYEGKVSVATVAVATIAGEFIDDTKMWHQAKKYYAQLLAEHSNEPIAQTFFNSVFGSIRGHNKIRDVHLFILKRQYRQINPKTPSIICHTQRSASLEAVLKQLLGQFYFRLPFVDLTWDLNAVQQAIYNYVQQQPKLTIVNREWQIEYGRSLFFRNKATYLIGCVMLKHDEQLQRIPFAVPILNDEQGGLFIDAIMLGESQLSMLFGFARAYFMVDTDEPVAYVDYLATLLPNKERFELFNAIGFIKHAKTEFYRFKVDSTRKMPPTECYQSADGIKGMVMLVFTTAQSEYVYKVIRDRFVPPKQLTRQDVMDKYEFVKNADRVGRLVDTHEFRYLAFDLSRFSPQLLAQLQQDAPSSVVISGKALILKHVYVERKMIPLNLYIKTASLNQLEAVMQDYGLAIKQLAAANIFAGDMLMKNFGVTRWGRVVFYDYDEICPMTQCHFRSLPKATTTQQAMTAEPWFMIESNDIFPEQFPIFFKGNNQAKYFFDRYHQDLYTPEYWQKIQQDIQQGVIADVFPYKQYSRFQRNTRKKMVN